MSEPVWRERGAVGAAMGASDSEASDSGAKNEALWEAQDLERRTRELWIQTQRESRKELGERSHTRLVEATAESLHTLTSIRHRIEGETCKAARESYKHCIRYAIQASIWLQCELGRVGTPEESESFAGLFNKFLSRNRDSLDKTVLDATNLDTILEYVESFGLPARLFVPLVDNPDQYLDRSSHERALAGLELNLKLILTLMPVLRLKVDADGDEEPSAPPANAAAPKGPRRHDIRTLALYALQFCANDSWGWKPSWTNVDLSGLGAQILETLVYRELDQQSPPASLPVLAAAVARTFPSLHSVVVERYAKAAQELEARSAGYAGAEDGESAFELTRLLHVLHWLMLGMSYRSFVDDDYSLSEELFPAILHACNSSTQSLQYCGLRCLSLLIRSAPATVVKWRAHEIYGSLGKFLNHSEAAMWAVGAPVVVEATVAIEGRDKDSERLLSLLESLVEQGETLTSAERYEELFRLMEVTVRSTGCRSCCFLGRILTVLGEGLERAEDQALGLARTLVEHAWPALILGPHDRRFQELIRRFKSAEDLDTVFRRGREAAAEAFRVQQGGDDRDRAPGGCAAPGRG